MRINCFNHKVEFIHNHNLHPIMSFITTFLFLLHKEFFLSLGSFKNSLSF